MNHECTDWTALINGLTAEALTVFNRRPMGRVQDPIESANGVPGLRPGTPPRQAVYLEGDTAAMSIPHHEDISVLGKSVIHHPLSGCPEFKGLIETPEGPQALIEDGDLSLRLDDLKTIRRWSEALRIAGAQLSLAQERAARREEGRS